MPPRRTPNWTRRSFHPLVHLARDMEEVALSAGRGRSGRHGSLDLLRANPSPLSSTLRVSTPDQSGQALSCRQERFLMRPETGKCH